MPEIKRKPKSEKAADRFRNAGFVKTVRPDEEPPEISESLSDYTMDTLADLITKYSNWREYAEDLANEQMVRYFSLKAEYEHEEAVFLVTLNAKPTDKKLMALADANLNRLRATLLEEELYYSMLTKKVESLSNTLSVLSREITRRKV